MIVSTLHLTALRTESLSFRIEQFIDDNILDIANKTIVKSIQEEAIKKELPERYIKNIKSEYDGRFLWIWVDFKGDNNEPLDVYFERGTRDHFIFPRFKKALRWIKNQKAIFSKGNFVRGIKAKHVFRDGLDIGYPEFKIELRKEIERHLKETTLFGR